MNTNETNYFELLERVNPAFNTAKQTLKILAASGDSDAIKIIQKIKEPQAAPAANISQEMILANLLMLETRYTAMKAFALTTGMKTFVDLPCGYTPRCFKMADSGIPFVGCDLEAVISDMAPIIDEVATDEQKKYIKYAAVDATNYDSLKAALTDVEGPICISTEGLMMYFTDSEMDELCSNIARLLKEYGGSWITMDPDVAAAFIIPASVLMGEEIMHKMLHNTGVNYSKTADIKMENNFIRSQFPEKMKLACDVLKKYGLKLEKISVADYIPELNSYSKLTEEQVAAYKEGMKKCMIWKMTLDAEANVSEHTESENCSFDTAINNGVWELALRGRVDTISSPYILSAFEKADAEQKITAINVDCSKLDYISSAGLRVLLIMLKKHPESVTLCNINEVVREILEQTGFMDIFKIIA